MGAALNPVPSEGWPIIDILFGLSVIFLAVGIIWSVSVMWRWPSLSLSAVLGRVKRRKSVQELPSIAELMRREAIRRGDGFDGDVRLDQRE